MISPALLLAVSVSAGSWPALPSPREVVAEARAKDPFVLRVLTYNIHGILPWLSGEKQEKILARYKEIARRLRHGRAEGTAPHIVAIQEAWTPYAAIAAKDAGYPYVLAGASASSGKLAGAGLFLLSEFPVELSETVDYGHCTGFDCLATKGVQHVRVRVPEMGRSLDVYNTHMNADGKPAKPEDSRKARLGQIKTYAAFVKKTRDPASPAVLLGDFNFKTWGEDYLTFDGLLGALHAAKDCLASGDCTGDDAATIWNEAIDHALALPGSGGALKASHIARTFKEPYEGKPLSDHLGLEARYLFAP
jgi:endonuclease/exonuclease/phosphatase family metal-dependent hydrolase